ncbi:thiamine diphosphate-binding protein [Mycena galericulata]|nr:thiamine diphosphate-binding protein [Mycena galericulata]
MGIRTASTETRTVEKTIPIKNPDSVEILKSWCTLEQSARKPASIIEKELCRKTCVIAAYRCHPFAVLCGGTIKGAVGELLGRQAGMSHGKGGSPSSAVSDRRRQHRLCAKVHGRSRSTATELGQVVEAKLWNHPCVFVCKNNKYGMGMSAERSLSRTGYFSRARDKILGLQVNGMEMNAVPGGPVCVQVEFVTYCYGGHSMSDPRTTYRTREERYIEWSLASEQELKQLDKDDKDTTAEADAPLLKFAMLPDARGARSRKGIRGHRGVICQLVGSSVAATGLGEGTRMR